jgi:putative intracellular protease/amidase
MATQEPKTVAFVLYPGLTLLDLVGPLQVFASLRRFSDQYRPVVVAERIEPMGTDGPLTVTADQTFGDVPDPTMDIVPGGDAPTIKATGDPGIRNYLRQVAETAPVVGSVCAGALVLAAAGLLEGRQATTHWAYHRLLVSWRVWRRWRYSSGSISPRASRWARISWAPGGGCWSGRGCWSGWPGRRSRATATTATSAQKPSMPRVMSSQPQPLMA